MVQYQSMQDDLREFKADFRSQVKTFVHKAKNYSNALQKNSYYNFQKAIQRGRLWRPDKGAAIKEITREEKKLPALIDMGSGNGLSKIRFRGLTIFQQMFHNIFRDFFTSVASLSIYEVILVMVIFYVASYLVWGVVWHLINKFDQRCIVNVNNFLDALIFAIATQSTIGYGNSSPGPCWLSSFILAANAIYGMLIDSIFLGVIFSLISHPKQRARTIFVSENCVVCKRDGILKLLFRVGDTRQYPVVAPTVKAFVYFWGRGFETHEQEQLPVRIEPLNINYMDYQLILPLACEHNIDSTSPLYQHTKESLEALDAEIVVIVEGSNEFGNSFMTRVSYLASEILWGHVFCKIIHRAQMESYHEVDLGHFHDTELMKEYKDKEMSQREISHELIKISVKPYVAFRAYFVLNLGQWQGERALLRTPILVSHIIDNTSPLRHWQIFKNVYADRNTEIFVLVEASKMISNDVVTAQRSFSPREQIQWGKQFFPVVIKRQKNPQIAVAWNSFNETIDFRETKQLQSISGNAMSPRYTFRDHSMDTLLGLCPKWDYIREEMMDNDDDDENLIVPINTQIELQESSGSKEELAKLKLSALQNQDLRSSSAGDFSDLLQRNTGGQSQLQSPSNGTTQSSAVIKSLNSDIQRSHSDDRTDQGQIDRNQESQQQESYMQIPLIPPPPINTLRHQVSDYNFADFVHSQEFEQKSPSPKNPYSQQQQQHNRQSSQINPQNPFTQQQVNQQQRINTQQSSSALQQQQRNSSTQQSPINQQINSQHSNTLAGSDTNINSPQQTTNQDNPQIVRNQQHENRQQDNVVQKDDSNSDDNQQLLSKDYQKS